MGRESHGSDMRFRFVESYTRSSEEQRYDKDDVDFLKKQQRFKGANFLDSELLGFKCWFGIFFIIALIYAFVVWKDLQMPPVISDAASNGSFSEERARRILEKIVALGPRPSGSEACEKHAFELITEKIREIQTLISVYGVNRLDLDVQHPSGCYDLSFLSAFTICYHSITNIVARLGPAGNVPTEHALLLNCHYDTLPDTPGATDDAVSCAIMLEVMEVLASRPEPLELDIIFLFNGAEENFLQGSHGFITQHPWRHAVRAFINLEGTGSGGREILFQSGPGDSWILETYMKSAAHPHCSVIAQEVFQSGIIPSDTDFRIFRDYGKLSGLDIAYHRNGWAYHTEFDRIETIHRGAIQRAGENVLAVTKALIRSPEMSQPAKFNEANKWIFFDAVGFFSIYYTINIGVCMNLVTVFAVGASIAYQLYHGNYELIDFLHAFLHNTFAIAAMAITGCVLAGALTITGQTMIWYATPELIFFIYVLPIVFAGLAVHVYFVDGTSNDKRLLADMAHYDSMLMLFTLVLVVMTAFKLASSFFAFIMVVIPVFRDPLLRLFGSMLGFYQEITPRILLAVQCFCMLPVIIFISYAVMMVFDFFVPVTGRFGNTTNPELLIMIASLAIACILVLYTNNLIYISRPMNYFISSSVQIWFLVMAIIMTTRLGYPYRFEENGVPRLRRIIALDTLRTVNDPLMDQNTTDHGMYLVSFDYRNTADMPQHSFTISNDKDTKRVDNSSILLAGGEVNCSQIEDEYCRLPYYTAVLNLLPPSKARYIPTAFPPTIPNPVTVTFTESYNRVNNTLHLKVHVLGGTGKISLHITPLNSYKLVDWSLGDLNKLRKSFSNRKTFFVFLTYGSEKPDNGVVFELVLEQPNVKNVKRLVESIEITAASFYTHGKPQNSAVITQFRQIIAERRRTPHAAVGYWRWAMTMIGGVADVYTTRHVVQMHNQSDELADNEKKSSLRGVRIANS